MISTQFLTKEEWKGFSKMAHEISFQELWDPEMERIDYAMLLVNEKEPVAFATLKEFKKDQVYIQYGGAFPSSKGTIVSYKAFARMVDDLLKKYNKITTLVENNNWGMLKYYWSARFKVTGIRFFKEHTFLEFTFESGTH